MKRIFFVFTYLALIIALIMPGTRIAVSSPPKAEKKLVVYVGGVSNSLLKAILKKFSKAHPEVNVRYLKLKDLDMLTKMTLEQNAGVYNADVLLGKLQVFHTSPELFLPLAENSIEARQYPAFAKDPNGKWVMVSGTLATLLYNPTMISKNELPSNYEELGTAKYKNKLLVTLDGGMYYAALIEHYGRARARMVVQKFLANAKASYRGGIRHVKMMIAGQAPLSLGPYGSTLKSGKRGAPIAQHKNFGPILLWGVGAFKAKNSPNPEAANQFVEFVLSESIQKIILGARGLSFRNGMATELMNKATVSPLLSKKEFKEITAEWKEFLR